MLPLPTRSTRYEILYEGEDGEWEDFDEDAEMEQNDNDEEDEDNLMPPIKKKSQDLTSRPSENSSFPTDASSVIAVNKK